MRTECAIAVALFASLPALAYEVDTHALITSHAYSRSVLATPALAGRLGLDRFNDNTPFRLPGDAALPLARLAYLDFMQEDWDVTFDGARRRIQEYEQVNMFSSPGEEFRTIPELQERQRAWLMRGAIREDDVSPFFQGNPPNEEPDPYGDIQRVTRHFYDPVRNEGLQFPPFPCVGQCVRSPDWAFGRDDIAGAASEPPDTQRRNHFTWTDAREALWCALTRNAGDRMINAAQNANDRRLCWATTIDALGHVLHLAQDTAQPQHVRNDAHAPVITSDARRTYEAWTNYRATFGQEPGAGSDSPFLAIFGSAVNTPIVTGLSYPVPSFAKPVAYFTTRQIETGTDAAALRSRRGLADFTNRQFFSEGTSFSTRYTLPPASATHADYEVQDRLIVDHPILGQLGERVLTTALVDGVKGGYVDTALAPYNNRVPLTALGLWAEFDSTNITGQYRVITLDHQTAHADLLIPRAIAYSAGLIDHFFRGKLEITVPADGLFSVIDQGTPHSVNALGYPLRTDDGTMFGFTQLRMRVRNDTAEVNESGTNPPVPIPRGLDSPVTSGLSSDPVMRAVVRYHRNFCYQPNLATERTIAHDGAITFPNCFPGGNRTAFQEVSVSAPVAANALRLNGAGEDLAFDFSQQPIPVNATDVIVQVVYRGPLGIDEDAIAVGSLDVREPTHLTLWNNTDYAGCNGNWVTGNAPGCNYPGGVARAIQTARLCIGGQLLYTRFATGGNGPITFASYARLAALLDDQPHMTRARLIVGAAGAELAIRDRSITGQARQATKETPTTQAPYLPDAMYIKRGIVGSFRPQPWYLIIGADPQPANDTGPNDIGALTQPFSPPASATAGGTMSFPEMTPAPNTACTAPALFNEPYFEDEIEAWFKQYGESSS